MTAIGALLFDFGGTLDLPGSHWLDRFLDHYRASGLELARAELDPAYAYATTMGYRAGREEMASRGLRELVRFLVDFQFDYLASHGPDRAREHLDRISAPERNALAQRIADDFAKQTAASMARTRGTLAILRRRFRMGVISNFYGNLERILAEAALAEFFSVILDSSCIGVFKPDPRIFRRAVEAFALAPGEIAVVGDSLSNDCVPAHALGLKTVWLRGNGSIPPYWEEYRAAADYTISALGELVELRW